MNRKIAFAFIVSIAVSLLIGYNLASLSNTYKMQSVASIKTINVKVYWNQNCTQPATLIDWGILEPSSSKTFTVYVKSSSNVPMTLLIYTENWLPVNASDYMTFTAEPNNVIIEASEIIAVNLTLTIASDIEGITNFSFDITFNGIG